MEVSFKFQDLELVTSFGQLIYICLKKCWDKKKTKVVIDNLIMIAVL